MTETPEVTEQQEAQQRRRPRDFTFVMPEDWFRIRMEPAHRERDIDALVDLLTARRSDKDSLAPELREMARNMTRFADPHAVELYLSLTERAGFPVACSMTVSVVEPQPAVASASAVVASFLVAYPEAETSTGELNDEPTGRVARRIPAKIDDKNSFDTIVVQHLFPVPTTTGFVLLDFSTPLVNVAEPMTALFDVIASSFRWVW